MKKENKPTFHADDGTIFTDALSAATHDAKAIFEDAISVHEFSDTQLLILAKNWQNILKELTRLDNEYLNSTTPIKVVVPGVPEKVCYDANRGDFFTTTADTCMGSEFRRRWIGHRHDFPQFAPESDDAAGADGNTSAGLAPVADFLQIPGETDPRG